MWRIIFDEVWYHVCDSIEASVQMTSDESEDLFVDFMNRQLKLNRAGCRVFGEYITVITDDGEIASV